MNFSELLKSKKFKVAVASIICLLVVDFANYGAVTPETLTKVAGIVMVYLGAQGYADGNKPLPPTDPPADRPTPYIPKPGGPLPPNLDPRARG